MILSNFFIVLNAFVVEYLIRVISETESPPSFWRIRG